MKKLNAQFPAVQREYVQAKTELHQTIKFLMLFQNHNLEIFRKFFRKPCKPHLKIISKQS